MSRKKTDIFVDYNDKPIIRGIKVGHDIENDCYWINLREIKDKLLCKNILMECSYIVQNFEKYCFSNILIEKTKYKVNIKIIFEKNGSNKFVSNDNLSDVIDNLELEKISEDVFNGELFPWYNVIISKLIPKQLKKKRIYLTGSYVVVKGEKLYLSQLTIDATHTIISDFYITTSFKKASGSRLNKKRRFIA